MVVSNIFHVHPIFGEHSHFDYYVSKGLKPPTSFLSPLVEVVVILKNELLLQQ